jgi:DNA-binding CsgD family transcriptional regulator
MLAEEPPLSKQMLELRLAGGTYTEIAQQLGINEKTVRRTIARLLEREAAERN